jgi:ribosomal-protein-alanine N-acetyltransferase
VDEQERITIRAASERDVPAIAAIQADAPEAAQWNPADYLSYDCRVAESGGAVVGFIVTRAVASSEWEILNLAVAATARRQGVGRSLLGDILAQRPIEIYLEVRESNTSARSFYEALGFRLVTTRLRYYADSDEAAIVMKLYSC